MPDAGSHVEHYCECHALQVPIETRKQCEAAVTIDLGAEGACGNIPLHTMAFGKHWGHFRS